MKKKVLILMMVVTLLLSATPALAANASSANQATATIDPVVTPQAMQFIAMGETSFENAGGGEVYITGELWGYGTYDVLGMDFCVQYWNGSSWVTAKVINSEGYNRSYYSISFIANFTPGYFYRIMTDYYIHEGSASEYARSYTSPLYIQ